MEYATQPVHNAKASGAFWKSPSTYFENRAPSWDGKARFDPDFERKLPRQLAGLNWRVAAIAGERTGEYRPPQSFF